MYDQIEMSDLADIVDSQGLIAQVGFPMPVAIYMLGRTDKRLDLLTQSLQELTA